MKRQLSYFLSTGLMVVASGVSALPSVFNDSVPDGIASFDSTVTSAGGTVTTDNLTGLSSGSSWARTGYTITSTSGSNRFIAPSYPGLTGQSIGINPTSPAATSGLTFSFASPINAFGLEIGDWATCCYLPSNLYISFDGGATKLVASAFSRNDNPGYVKERQYANFIGAVYDTATFSNIIFYGDGFGEYLTAGGTIRFATVPIGSFGGGGTPVLNYQPLITNSISGMKQQAMNIFHRLTGRLHGLDNQYKDSREALNQTSLEALAMTATAAAGQYGTGQYITDVANSLLAQQDLALSQQANGLSETARDVMDFFTIGGARGFIKARYHIGDRDPIGSQDGFDFKGYTVTAGVDKNVKPNFIIGAGLGYSRHESEADTTNFDIDSESLMVTVFSSWAPQPDMYVDAVLSFGNTDHTTKRRYAIIEGGSPEITSTGKPDSDEYLAAISVGKIFGWKEYTYGPFGGIQYAYTDVDAYNEFGGTAPQSVGSQSAESLTAHAGVQGTWTVKKNRFDLVSQLSLAVEHEFQDSDQNIAVGPVGGPSALFTILGDEPDTYGRISAGLAFNHKTKPHSIRVDYEGLVGRDNTTAHAITARLRWAFD